MFSVFGLKTSGFQFYFYSSLNVEKLFILKLDVLSSVLYRWRSLEATVKIKLKTRSRRFKSKA